MADLYDFPDIYDERFTDKANEVYRSHYQKMFEGKGIQSVLDCSIGTGCLTFCLAELGYHVSGSD
ncbi:MAG: SAM-dependent methyltransferase, partial [Acetatifactor sp.]|nr:SAM-dependent methyltransferase [Acetatifactor sp.]